MLPCDFIPVKIYKDARGCATAAYMTRSSIEELAQTNNRNVSTEVPHHSVARGCAKAAYMTRYSSERTQVPMWPNVSSAAKCASLRDSSLERLGIQIQQVRMSLQ